MAQGKPKTEDKFGKPILKTVPKAPKGSSAHFQNRLAEIRLANYVERLKEWAGK